ncbi:unnamed protein product [Brachionus calyciflorus]|uniref:BEN domain-containing protein n=1 Tax=Brachionus calyciflorus TaxID=104777 RepID=A0A813YSM9_9BILA|nr:unnamed protein product [Brachionus calyciflorus]
MSKSTPLKRKFISNRKNLLDSESDDDIPIKSEYGIISEKQISLDDFDTKIGKVKHYSKAYNVKILKKGTYEFIEKIAEKYSFNLSLNTCDESETDRQILNSLRSPPVVTTRNLMDHNLFDDENTPAFEVNQATNNAFHEGRIQNLINAVARQPSSNHNDSSFFHTNLQSIFNNYQESLKNLEKRIEDLSRIQEPKSFIYNGVDLIKDINGYPAHQWAANCLKVLFTQDEAKDHVLVPTSKSNRPACCSIKVNLLKDALKYKYNFAPEKTDKVWKMVITAFNSRGRGFKSVLKNATNNLLHRIRGTSE